MVKRRELCEMREQGGFFSWWEDQAGVEGAFLVSESVIYTASSSLVISPLSLMVSTPHL